MNFVIPDSYCIRYFFQRLDHISIYIMIAGCYTCFILTRTFAKGWNKMGFLAIFIIFAMALGGFALTLVAPPTTRTDVIMYLAMGWSCIIYGPAVVYFCPYPLIFYLFSGGVSYAIGTIFVSWDKLFFNHGIWHMVVWFANFQHSLAVLIATDDENVVGFARPWTLMKELFLEFIGKAPNTPVMKKTSVKIEE
ncbi:hemolysin-3, putative [Entamoeba invadens IP1]|uniref:hemolysin-3, putative n=1 Tax=Entamoeba invadens IP1 TaxID=370355 RepID=UPI0002C3EF25|nr:hemolysin-3, putative [Entamoeba invadens IP1]ELP94123.1 hemolysin-3, putative [Entamoeba invadens IP1]|eukprot:XP_004260894.1 hemolysin-3, putative [Entamoeba invadens IP1]